MLGAVAGDIIASPYVKKNAHNSTFEMFASVHEYHDGKTTTYYPKVTDATVMTLAVARWIATDPEHRKGTFISCMQEAYARYPDCGFSPTMGIWCNSEFFRPFTRETNDPVARVSPIGLSVDDLKDAIDLARMSAEFTHTNPDSIKGAEALTMAIWQACHGRSKDDIRFAMENDYGIDFSLPEADLKSILMGAQKEDIMINGEPTGESYYRESNKIDYSTMNTLTAALRSFLEGNSFVDVVRRAVALGGDSTTITSMAGALAHAFYKEIPEVIVKECSKKMENDLKNTMESFELSLKKQPTAETEKTLLHIYKENEMWPGNLNLLIKGFGINVDNRALPDDIGEIRTKCGQRCMSRGTCNYCNTAILFAEALRKKHEELNNKKKD